jgi:uncharacterized protein (TIRG00374 family)
VETAIDRGKTEERKSVWNFLLKAAVSIVLLWLALRHVALGAVARQIATIAPAALVGALLILSGATLVAALRWSVILGALGMPRSLRVTYPLSLIGLFFGQALPAGVGGDVVRVWLGRKTGLTTAVAISSILGDRLTGLLAILMIVTAQLAQLRGIFPDRTLFYSLILILTAGYTGFVVLMLLDKLPEQLRRFRIIRGFARVSADLRRTLLVPSAGLPVLLCGFVIQLANVFAVYTLAAGLHVQVGLASCLLVVSIANVVQSLPISIAGWGVRESFFVAALGMVGVTAAQAVAISVVFGLIIVVSSLPGGILWLMQGVGGSRKIPSVASIEAAEEL